MNNNEIHQKAVNDIIALANQMKDDGVQPQIIAAALMSASGLYSTYVHAGNEGFLRDSGVKKLVSAYERRVNEIQNFKKHQAEKSGAKPENA